MSELELDRRQFLILTGASAGAAVLGGCTDEKSEAEREAERQKRIEEFKKTKDDLEIVDYEDPRIGGLWVAPANNAVIEKEIVTLSAIANRSKDAPPIDFVVFTRNHRGRWDYVDAVRRLNKKGVWATQLNTSPLELEPGELIEVSFEVVAGNLMKKSPHGRRRVFAGGKPPSPTSR